MEEKFVPGPERKLTLAVVTPDAANAGVPAMMGASANAMTLRIGLTREEARQAPMGAVSSPPSRPVDGATASHGIGLHGMIKINDVLCCRAM
jgi:hypothetical protein